MSVFSLIIPVYNVESYLAECLDSCINQTFKDLEIICINDCSTDNSAQILEEYVKKDIRIKVIDHCHNKGLGGARNTGISAAQGDYCWFIDSDDMIPLDACELLLTVIKKTLANIIRFNSMNFEHDNCYRLGSYGRIDECGWPYNKNITRKELDRVGITEVTAWSYVTISSHLKKFKFRESVFHEDIDFTPILFSEAESIYCINTTLYFRRLHGKSITGGGASFEKRIVDGLLAIDSLRNYVIVSKLPKSHFCVKIMQGSIKYWKEKYNEYPEIHNDTLDSIIAKAEKMGAVFSGDLQLYDDIIKNYGNTGLLEFILRVYRFMVKRIF